MSIETEPQSPGHTQPGASATQRELDEFVALHGPWSAHNIHLGGGVYTMGSRPLTEVDGLRRILQTVQDIAGKPIDQLRLLDLGCGEGLCGIEFARHGAQVVCMDGREANLEKGRFVQRALGLTGITFRQDDVRNLSEARYGRFDVVLCVGLLYHLNDPDMLELLHNIEGVCDRVALVHTHVSVGQKRSFTWQGREYHGRDVLEHLPGEDQSKAVWGSLHNAESFWLTRASLTNALMDVGFTSVAECRIPFVPWQPGDHTTLVAIKGAPAWVHAMPAVNETLMPRIPERLKLTIHPSQKWFYRAYRRVSPWIHPKFKAVLRRIVVRVGGLGMWWSMPEKGHRG